MSESLISPESVEVVKEVLNFLESAVVSIKISNEIEKKNAITLGNELQKKWNRIEKARKAEKSIWDAKAKLVQEEFKPTLDKITEKKNTLFSAITVYDRNLEIERQRRQNELEDISQKERDALEKFAGKREDRLNMYQDKLADCQRKYNLCHDDKTAGDMLYRDILYYHAKIAEFTEKVAETRHAAASIVTPIYRPETPAATKGTRVTYKANLQIINMISFVQWCLERDELQFITIDEFKLKQRVREKEGRLEIPGVECSYLPETGPSGR